MGLLYLNGDPASVGIFSKNLISINEFDLSPSIGAYECNVNLPKGTYTLSFKIEGDIPSNALCYISGQYFEYQSYSSLEIESTNPSKYAERNSVTFTTDKNLKSIGIMIQKSAMPMPESVTCHLAQIQLEKGSSMTEYVVYKSNLKIDGLAEEISATKDIIGKDNLGEGVQTITGKLLDLTSKLSALETVLNGLSIRFYKRYQGYDDNYVIVNTSEIEGGVYLVTVRDANQGTSSVLGLLMKRFSDCTLYSGEGITKSESSGTISVLLSGWYSHLDLYKVSINYR